MLQTTHSMLVSLICYSPEILSPQSFGSVTLKEMQECGITRRSRKVVGVPSIGSFSGRLSCTTSKGEFGKDVACCS